MSTETTKTETILLPCGNCAGRMADGFAGELPLCAWCVQTLTRRCERVMGRSAYRRKELRRAALADGIAFDREIDRALVAKQKEASRALRALKAFRPEA